MTEQGHLVAQLLDDIVEIGDVPSDFEASVREHIATRPSPTPHSDPLQEISRKLDDILTILRGGTT